MQAFSGPWTGKDSSRRRAGATVISGLAQEAKAKGGRRRRRRHGSGARPLAPPVPRDAANRDGSPGELYLGVDIGGTGVKAAVVDQSGRMVTHAETPTRAHEGRDAILRRAIELARGVLGRAPGPVMACGIGSAGRIDYDLGLVAFASGNLPGWTGLDLAGAFAAALGLKATADNDVNAAALAEGWIGAARGVENYLTLTLGTGVGGAVVIGGKLWRGVRWGAGEIGHMTLYPGGHACNCGGKGCAEQYVSAKALTRRANDGLRGGSPFRGIREVLGAAGSPGSDQRQQAARAGATAFTNDLAMFLVNLQNAYDPSLLLIGGGILKMGYWWPKLEEALEREAAARSILVDVRPAACGPHAGVIGAARVGMVADGKPGM